MDGVPVTPLMSVPASLGLIGSQGPAAEFKFCTVRPVLRAAAGEPLLRDLSVRTSTWFLTFWEKTL